MRVRTVAQAVHRAPKLLIDTPQHRRRTLIGTLLIAVTAVAIIFGPHGSKATGSCDSTISTNAAAIQAAVNGAAPGSTICVAPGTYSGSLTLSVNSSAPGVTLTSATPGAATIGNVNITGSYITVSQFIINGYINATAGSNHATFDHNDVAQGAYSVGNSGSYAQYTTISNNIIHHPTTGGEEDAILGQYFSGLTIQNNQIYIADEDGNHNDAFQSTYNNKGLIFSGNWLLGGAGSQGFFLKDGTVTNVTFEDNLIAGRTQASAYTSAPFQVYDAEPNASDPFYDPAGHGLIMRHNTIWQNPNYSFFRTCLSSNVLVERNVLDGLNAAADTGYDAGCDQTAQNTWTSNNITDEQNHNVLVPDGGLGAISPVTGAGDTSTPPTFIKDNGGDPNDWQLDPSSSGYFGGGASRAGITWNPATKVFGPETGPPADTTPPTVSVTAPSDGSSIKGTVVFSANANDDTGVVGVQFKVDGVNQGAEDTGAPYSISWDTTGATNGTHTLTAVARDAASNTTTSTSVTVTVDNAAPTVSITSPTASSTVSGSSVALSATANDNIGVVGVQFKVDGSNVGAEDTSAPYSVNWDSTAATNSTHTITAVARDAAGNTTTSSSVSITVDNTGPAVSLTAPASGAKLRGSVDITASASSAPGIDNVQFQLDGSNLGAPQTSAPYAYSWDTTTASDGSHTLTAIATDNNSAQTTSTSVTVNVDNTAPSVNITSPASSSLVRGTVTFSAIASDNDQVSNVDFKVDGTSVGSDTGSPYSINWDTTSTTSGSHTLTAVASDPAGNQTTSSTITVEVDNDPPDTVIALGPTGSVTDTAATFIFSSNEIADFECKLDGGSFTVCTSPIVYSSLSAGSHTFMVRAVDAAGNVDASPAVRSWTITSSTPPPSGGDTNGGTSGGGNSLSGGSNQSSSGAGSTTGSATSGGSSDSNQPAEDSSSQAADQNQDSSNSNGQSSSGDNSKQTNTTSDTNQSPSSPFSNPLILLGSGIAGLFIIGGVLVLGLRAFRASNAGPSVTAYTPPTSPVPAPPQPPVPVIQQPVSPEATRTGYSNPNVELNFIRQEESDD